MTMDSNHQGQSVYYDGYPFIFIEIKQQLDQSIVQFA